MGRLFPHIRCACTNGWTGLSADPAEQQWCATHYEVFAWGAGAGVLNLKTLDPLIKILPYQLFNTMSKEWGGDSFAWYVLWRDQIDLVYPDDYQDSAAVHYKYDTTRTSVALSKRYDDWLDGLWRHNGTAFDTNSLHFQKSYAVLRTEAEYLYVGFAEGRFDQINLANLGTWGAGLTLAAEYWDGLAWQPLTITDGTAGFSQAGQISWFPPTDWKRCKAKSTGTGIAKTDLYSSWYIRLRTTTTPTTAPAAGATYDWQYCLRGEIYVPVIGTTYYYKGWLAANDADNDGYVSAADRAQPTYNPAATAKFPHQARVVPSFAPYSMIGRQWYFNNTLAPVRAAVVAMNAPKLAQGYDGFFFDCAADSFGGAEHLEITSPEVWYQANLDWFTAWKAAYPDSWNVPNLSEYIERSVWGGTPADTFDRDIFGILGGIYAETSVFGYYSQDIERRKREVGYHRAVVEPYPHILECRADPAIGIEFVNSPRTQLYCLAGYYLDAHDDPYARTYFSYGGRAGSGSTHYRYTKHSVDNWFGAIEFNIGVPVENKYFTWKSGTDPLGTAYVVWGRHYQNGNWVNQTRQALMLQRPRSLGGSAADTGSNRRVTLVIDRPTSSTPEAGDGWYRQLNADGTLSDPTQTIALDGYQGAILIPFDSETPPEPPEDPESENPVIVGLSAPITRIKRGQSVTITRSSLYATTQTVDQGIGTVVGDSGTFTVRPKRSTRYTLTATNANSTATASIMIEVDQGKLTGFLR